MLQKKLIIRNSLKLLSNFLQDRHAKYLTAIILIVGGYLALFYINTIDYCSDKTFCAFKLITTIPCPGCGMGRATLALLHGDIIRSLSFNFLCIPFTLSILISLLWMIIDLLYKSDSFFRFIKTDIKIEYKYLLYLLLIINWSINIIRL